MPKSAELEIFNVRLPQGTIERIQRYRDHLNRTQPGIEATASTAARILLFRALEMAEVEIGRGQRSPGVRPAARNARGRSPP